MQAYPNPFTASFKIIPLDGEKATLFYQVYDMTGKLIDNREVAASEVSELQIGDNFSSGVYNVIVSQGENTKAMRIVKH